MVEGLAKVLTDSVGEPTELRSVYRYAARSEATEFGAEGPLHQFVSVEEAQREDKPFLERVVPGIHCQTICMHREWLIAHIQSILPTMIEADRESTHTDSYGEMRSASDYEID